IRAREWFCKSDGAECVHCGCELRLAERLVKFLLFNSNNLGGTLQGCCKLLVLLGKPATQNDERRCIKSQRNTHAGAVGRASESRGQLGVREVPEPGESQWQAAARSPLRKVSPLLLARCL